MRVWVTGADGSIGSECCKALGNHDVYPMSSAYDLRSKAAIDTYIGSFYMELDALVYAAGANHLEWSDKIHPSDMANIYDVNVIGLVRCLQLRPEIKRCVVIGSDAARRPMRTSIAYNASKAALDAAVKVIARERAGDGFIINVVAPGLVYPSNMTDYVIRRTKDLRPGFPIEGYMRDQLPTGKAVDPTDVARTVKWLLEDAPEYINGSIIDVNGAR